MRDNTSACNWCWGLNNAEDSLDVTTVKEDPSVALGHPKMASDDVGTCGSRSQEQSHARYAGAAEPDAGIPGHIGPVKQLHSGTGYNLAIDCGGKIYGTREPYHSEAILQITARHQGEVQIQGLQSKFYIAMNEKGKIYAEIDPESPNTWFRELYEDGWNHYLWMGNEEEWYLAINKKGKMKPGYRTKKKQKAVKFIPRTAAPSN